jgi:UDP-GlcNAc:undecaprenyl-phosphate GlcNAc-1-phosphate transferase
VTIAIITVFATACAISFALTFIIRRIAPRIGLVDRPDDFRKLHKNTTPLGGGLAVFLASAGMIVAVGTVPNPLHDEIQTDAVGLWPLLAAALVIVAVGVLDDLVGLRGRQKFLGQVAAASILAAGGLSIDRIQVFGIPVELGLLGFVFTLFWLLGAINAVNLLDGMDGFATVLGIILSAATALIAALSGHAGVAILAVVFAGSLAGFLWWNLPPASIFLGDAGSMLIGLTVGTLAIAGSMKGPGTVLLAAPLAVWTIPVLDSAAAVLRRRLTGRSIYTTDRGHLHHRLLDRFASNRGVLAVVALLCLATATGALLSLFYRNDLVAMITSGAVVAVIVATGVFGRAECRLLLSSLRRGCLSLVQPNARNGSNGHQASIRLQGSRHWEVLWETLVESGEKLRLSEIRFDVNMPAMREGFHASWKRDNRDHPEERLWSLGVPLVSEGKVIGRVAIVGEADSAPLGDRLDQVVEMLDGVEGLLDVVGQEATPVPASSHAIAHSNAPIRRRRQTERLPQ